MGPRTWAASPRYTWRECGSVGCFPLLAHDLHSAPNSRLASINHVPHSLSEITLAVKWRAANDSQNCSNPDLRQMNAIVGQLYTILPGDDSFFDHGDLPVLLLRQVLRFTMWARLHHVGQSSLMTRYLACHRGFRFSAKALVPSRLSAVLRSMPNRFCSS